MSYKLHLATKVKNPGTPGAAADTAEGKADTAGACTAIAGSAGTGGAAGSCTAGAAYLDLAGLVWTLQGGESC